MTRTRWNALAPPSILVWETETLSPFVFTEEDSTPILSCCADDGA